MDLMRYSSCTPYVSAWLVWRIVIWKTCQQFHFLSFNIFQLRKWGWPGPDVFISPLFLSLASEMNSSCLPHILNLELVKTKLRKKKHMHVKWITTGVQENPNLSVLVSPVCVSRYKLEKIDAARAFTREEANQCVRHSGESVRDTLQKPACPPVDPTVQLESMIYSGCSHKSLQRSSHGSGRHWGSRLRPGLGGLLRNEAPPHKAPTMKPREQLVQRWLRILKVSSWSLQPLKSKSFAVFMFTLLCQGCVWC